MDDSVKELVAFLKGDIKDEIKAIRDTLGKHEQEITTLRVNECGRDQKIDTIYDICMELKTKVETVLNTPAKRWDSLILVLLTVVITVAINLIAKFLFKV